MAKDLTKPASYVLVLFVDTPADIDDLAMLAEFAQLAMARARAAAARAEAVEAEGGDPQAHLVAFDRMGRAMRLALSLRRRFLGQARDQAAQRVLVRKDQLKAALIPAIRLHAEPLGQRQLLWELDQRLETEAEAFASLSLEAGLMRLRHSLGLPDFVRTQTPSQADLGNAEDFNPLASFAGGPAEGEQLEAPVPPPAQSAIRGRWCEAPRVPATATAATEPFPGPRAATRPP
jgi:hypothetical protein